MGRGQSTLSTAAAPTRTRSDSAGATFTPTPVAAPGELGSQERYLASREALERVHRSIDAAGSVADLQAALKEFSPRAKELDIPSSQRKDIAARARYRKAELTGDSFTDLEAQRREAQRPARIAKDVQETLEKVKDWELRDISDLEFEIMRKGWSPDQIQEVQEAIAARRRSEAQGSETSSAIDPSTATPAQPAAALPGRQAQTRMALDSSVAAIDAASNVEELRAALTSFKASSDQLGIDAFHRNLIAQQARRKQASLTGENYVDPEQVAREEAKTKLNEPQVRQAIADLSRVTEARGIEHYELKLKTMRSYWTEENIAQFEAALEVKRRELGA